MLAKYFFWEMNANNQFFKKYLKVIKILGYAFISVYSVSQVIEFIHGSSNFGTTTVFYGIFLLLFIYISKKLNIQKSNFFIVVIASTISLLASEIFLRFIVKYPLTYSERQWGEYFSMYDRFGSIKSAIPIHKLTKENTFKPYQILSYQTPEFSFPLERANRLGLRGSLPAHHKHIIVTLGDSFTESFGSPLDSTYPLLLEKFYPAKDSIKVINAGISGSDPFHEFELLKMLTKEFKIKTAVLMINTSDIIDVISRGGKERFVNGCVRYKSGPWWEPFYALSYVFRLVMHNCFGYDYSLLKPIAKQEAMKDAICKIVSLIGTDIYSWSEKNNADVKIILQPMYTEFEAKFTPFDQLRDALLSAKVSFLDLRDSLVTHPNPERLYWKADGHFNSEGCKEVAKYVYRYMKMK